MTDTETVILKFDSICRACLNAGELKPINSETQIEDENVNLKELFLFSTSIQVEEDDSLPNKICLQCLNEAYNFYKFKRRCQKSDETLKYYINIADSALKNQDVGDCVVDLVIKTTGNPINDVKTEYNVAIENVDPRKKENESQKGPPFHCKICDIEFVSRVELAAHRKQIKHSRLHTSTCPVCFRKFPHSKLQSHMFTHTGEKPYKCETCGKLFSGKFNLKRHEMTHTGERPHICEHCGKGFIRSTNLQDHIRTHTGETPFVCSYCGKSFGQSKPYAAHLKRHKRQIGGSQSNDVVYKCDTCDKVLQSSSSLKAHMLTHGMKSFLCTDCGKSFTSKFSLMNHINVHSGEKPYACTFCGKFFSTKAGLATHILIHTGEKKYICELCSKSFTQSCHLKRHIKVHTGEKPFRCTMCEKSYAHNEYLTVHMRIHTGETPYKCDVCEKGFYDSSSMKKHRKAHNKMLS